MNKKTVVYKPVINLGKFTGKSTTDFLGITIAVKYITVSSAYIRIWHRSRTIGRSLTNRTKSKGPRIDPCGTPDVIRHGSEILYQNSRVVFGLSGSVGFIYQSNSMSSSPYESSLLISIS